MAELRLATDSAKKSASIHLKAKKQLGTLLLDYELTVPNKGIIFLYGPSGAGKTSLINIMAGLLTPDEGQVLVENTCLFDSELGINNKTHQRSIGYVFQDTRLFPHLTVEENLFYSPKAKMNKQTASLMELLDISKLLKHKPHALSGGEKQRVAIARALFSEPDILLLDEPFSFLDHNTKQELIYYFHELVRNLNIPIIMVSHIKEEVFQLADYLVFVERGQIRNTGPVESVWNKLQMELVLTQKTITTEYLFPVRFVATHRDYAMIKIELLDPESLAATDCYFWVNNNLKGNVTQQQSKKQVHRLQINTDSIHVLPFLQEETFEQNIIDCFIKETMILSTGNKLLTLSLTDNILLFQQVSSWMWDEMQLEVGQKIKIQINQLNLIS